MWRIYDVKGWVNTIAVKFYPSVWWNSVIRGPARAQRSAEDVGMRRCYYINTTALLTPGSYFLRRNPRWFRGLFYSNRSGVRHASLTPHSTPLCSFPPLSLSPSLSFTDTQVFSSNFRTISLLTCPGVDFHLDHRPSCPSSPCPEERCSALLKCVNVKKKKRGEWEKVRHAHNRKRQKLLPYISLHVEM